MTAETFAWFFINLSLIIGPIAVILILWSMIRDLGER